MNNCNEQFLNEVIHIELVPSANCSLTIPFNVGELTDMPGMNGTTDRIGTPSMVIDVNEVEGCAGILDSAPTLKTTEKPQAAGYLRQHDLSIPIMADYEEVRKARASLNGVDFHVILKTAAGTRFLLYALPNTSQVSVEDQFGGDAKQTVKVSLQSMSAMIRLT